MSGPAVGERGTGRYERCPGPPEGTGPDDGSDPGPCPTGAGTVWGTDKRNGSAVLRCTDGCGFYRYAN